MVEFNTSQVGMAVFLLLCAGMNAWFVYTGCVMNTFRHQSSQAEGDDSSGCVIMGLYSTASLGLMMGSHCLVAFYLYQHLKGKDNLLKGKDTTPHFVNTPCGLISVASAIFATSWLLGTFPLMEGGGYRLTSGGFCYADFTRTAQAAVMLCVVVLMLSLSTMLWVRMGFSEYRWAYYVVFALTWLLWVPACIYGLAHHDEITYPYMIIGGITGHGNAVANPVLYGMLLFETYDMDAKVPSDSSPFPSRPPSLVGVEPSGSGEESEYGLAGESELKQ